VQAPEGETPAGTPYQSFLRQLEGIAKGHAVTAHEIEERLALERSRVSTWLKRAVAEGWVKKLAKPVRYAWRDGAPAQDSMFG
jgi:predicted transcriptional regulator